jgi:hypothetical protein
MTSGVVISHWRANHAACARRDRSAGIFRGPIALPSPRLKIGLGAVQQEHAPCGLEIDPRLVERRRGTALMFAGMGSRIKPAAPAPLSAGLPERSAIEPMRTSP